MHSDYHQLDNLQQQIIYCILDSGNNNGNCQGNCFYRRAGNLNGNNNRAAGTPVTIEEVKAFLAMESASNNLGKFVKYIKMLLMTNRRPVNL